MALSIAVTIGGSPTQDDGRAAKFIVSQENERRAALDPPGAVLPTNTAAALAKSYETVLVATLVSAHESYVKQAAESYVTDASRAAAFKSASDSVRSQIDALLGLV